MLERYLIVWLGLLSAAAYYWPTVAPSGPDPFLALWPWRDYFIAAIMLCVGCLLPRDELAELKRRWPSVLFGTAVQYTSMPLLGWLASRVFPLETGAMIGVVLVGCVPGAMASNVITMVARGHVSYSVCLTTSSTLLSPLVVPLALYLTLGQRVALNAGDIAENLALTVAGPVVVGYVLCRRFAFIERGTQRLAAPVAHVLILWLIAMVVAATRDKLGQGVGTVFVALVAVNFLGYLAGYVAGVCYGLPEPMRRALTIEVGMQNAGVGTILAARFFPEYATAVIPTAMYTVGCMLTGTILAQTWAWRDRRQSVVTSQAPHV